MGWLFPPFPGGVAVDEFEVRIREIELEIKRLDQRLASINARYLQDRALLETKIAEEELKQSHYELYQREQEEDVDARIEIELEFKKKLETDLEELAGE